MPYDDTRLGQRPTNAHLAQAIQRTIRHRCAVWEDRAEHIQTGLHRLELAAGKGIAEPSELLRHVPGGDDW